ncbi:hypothetical protein [Arthrobacter sp. Y-9]|uniref:hypothetical protein n=1 Tax=Arthrobacter sp. Y-9 TaxID=3039385 RepID=UPI00241EBB21|nr:hypothetical protein [Arthrobacter sp. Y-9]WFR83985.1 hypothetical protein P9849_15730 [Arthrobacter sp. Y-9]
MTEHFHTHHRTPAEAGPGPRDRPTGPGRPQHSRRSVVRASAWSVPVIAAAVAAPAAVASAAPGLALTGVPGVVVAGAVVQGVITTATATGGQDVAVTLPTGFVWVDGAGGAGLPRVVGRGDGAFTVPPFRAGTVAGTASVAAEIRGTSVTATAVLTVEAVYSMALLGGINAIGGGPDEFRADFTAIVPRGVRPRRLEYLFHPEAGAGWTVLSPTAPPTGQRYDMVHAQRLDDDFERIFLSARGDADVPNAPFGSYSWPIRATWPDGAVTTLSMPFEHIHFGSDGRPLGVNAWDTITAGVPGYPGPDSQTGWGNVIDAGSDGLIDGNRFFVGAKTSGRTPAEGNDRTTSVFFQFVHESGAAASVTPAPRALTVPDYVSDASGVYLGATLGSFRLDLPGYWKLLVWPQSSNSQPGNPATPDGVAWDPATEPGHQLGSVFYRLAP